MTTATLCPSCGETVAEEDDFCESCGARLHAPPPQEGTCPTCGALAETADADGYSRAYWIDATSPEACRLLSHDGSLAEAAIAAGASPEEAYARRDAHTITHWLGTDAPELAPHIETMTVPGPGVVLVCSDGLWNYYETPASLRELVAAGPPGEGVLETA